MSQTRIYQALLEAVLAVPGMVPLNTPGIAESQPAMDPFGDFAVIFNQPEVYTLGDRGEDMVDGFVQVTLKWPQNKGSLAIRQLGDNIRTSFKAGKRFFYGGQEVIILNAGLGGFSTIDAKLVAPVTINFYALVRR